LTRVLGGISPPGRPAAPEFPAHHRVAEPDADKHHSLALAGPHHLGRERPAHEAQPGVTLQRADMHVGQRRPPPSCTAKRVPGTAPSCGASRWFLLRQHPDPHRAVSSTDLPSVTVNAAFAQPVGERASPLITGQDEDERSQPCEPIGQQPSRAMASFRCSAAAQRCTRSGTRSVRSLGTYLP